MGHASGGGMGRWDIISGQSCDMAPSYGLIQYGIIVCHFLHMTVPGVGSLMEPID